MHESKSRPAGPRVLTLYTSTQWIRSSWNKGFSLMGRGGVVLVCTGRVHKSTLYTRVRVVCVGKWGDHTVPGTQKYIPYTVLEEELFENFF